MRRVAGAGGEVQEERLVRVDGAQVAEELDRAVGQVLGEVVAVLDRPRAGGRCGCRSRARERTGASRRRGSRTSGRSPRASGQVAREAAMLVSSSGDRCHLPDRVAGIARGAQDLAQVAVLARRLAPVAGVANGQVGDPAHAAAMMIAPGQQAGAGGRAQRGGVEVRQPDAGSGQPVEHRRLDVGAVTAQLGVADVVQDDEQDVRRSGRGRRLRRPPGLRVPPGGADPAAVFLSIVRCSFPPRCAVLLDAQPSPRLPATAGQRRRSVAWTRGGRGRDSGRGPRPCEAVVRYVVGVAAGDASSCCCWSASAASSSPPGISSAPPTSAGSALLSAPRRSRC